MSTTKDIPKIYVLDGGFSSQISRHVGSTADGDPLWTASFLQTNPEDVMKTHLDFLRAGADIISTNTYQASIPGFVKRFNITESQAYDLIRLAVDLANKAVKKYTEECLQNGLPVRKPIIAGSVGPYGAYLHDGSEYTGKYADKTPAELMRDWHKPRIDTLVKKGVQLLAIETIPCEEEALALVDMLKQYPDIKAWITFSCKDSKSLVHGENLKTVARKCWELNSKQLVGVGINCCSPEIVIDVVKNLNDNEENKIPFVTYPNSGEKYNPDMGWIDKDKCKPLASYVDNWLDNNVRYVGGCCRTCAEDIENIQQQVQKWIKSNS